MPEERWSVREGDCLAVMPDLAPESVDAVVTDPPYNLDFMGHEWDKNLNHGLWAAEALRVLRPGGHLLSFGGTRTFHRLTCAIEDAGFEIRDCLSWLYGSGFPKSRNLDGDWKGWGTALKPAWEPIVLARKPLAGTVAANVEAHGTGALNVDGCRIEHAGEADLATSLGKNPGRDDLVTSDVYGTGRPQQSVNVDGRWPANVVLDPEAGEQLDEHSGERAAGHAPGRANVNGPLYEGGWKAIERMDRVFDSGGASRFFYCAKASRSERNAGLDGFEERTKRILNGGIPSAVNSDPRGMSGGDRQAKNHHPTVKPIALMRWLCRLVTPPGGLILDPFLGSGTTGIAAVLEGFDFTGIEREPEYAAIARARIAHHAAQPAQLGLEVGR